LTWQWLKFQQLSLDQLYEILAFRQSIFVVEQNCPYQDADGLDRYAWHLMGRNDENKLIAYLRVIVPGHKFPEPSIGRVLTSGSTRNRGIGKELMLEGIRWVEEHFPDQSIRISAQQRVAPFYQELGFRVVSEPYDEDGIPHIEMLRFKSASPGN